MLKKDLLSIFGCLELVKNRLRSKEPPLNFFGIVTPYSFSTKPNSCFVLKTLSYFD